MTKFFEAPQPYYLFTAELSQEIDRRTTEEMHINSFTLMEIAGSSAARILMNKHPDLSHGLYLCGKGNNGGDALVVARYLLQNGINATLVFLSGTENLSPDTDKNLNLLNKFNSQNKLTIFESWENFDSPTDYDFIIDGMLGTGLSSDVRSDYAKGVSWVNEQQKPVFAMDIPTGLHSDTGDKMGYAVEATQTFAFGGRKQGFYFSDGPFLTGEIHYCELPFPNQYKKSCNTFLLDESWISIESPTPGRHKYDSGVLYIVAGSEGLTGAAIMAAKSAWAEGLGAVILICPCGVLPIYEQQLPSIIKKPVGNRDDFFFKAEHADDVLKLVGEKEGEILVGPGLGRNESTVQFLNQLLTKNTADVVIDADGLWGLAQLSEWPKPEQSRWILTPHPGELQQLVSGNINNDHQRLQTIRKYAQDRNVTLFSKGMPGIIATFSGTCFITNYNTRFFARAGSGDVLAGKISARLALGDPPDKSCAAALLQGKQKLDYLLQKGKKIPDPIEFI